MHEPILFIDRLLNANCTADSLKALKKQADQKEKDFLLSNGLLLYKGRLIVPISNTLIADLIQEAYDQISFAHPGQAKTACIIGQKYCWKGLSRDVA